VRDFLNTPTKEQIECQQPKPILVNTGGMDNPYAWDPSTLALQVLRVGQLVIVAVPSEFTTMAGRRLRKTVLDIVQPLLDAEGDGAEAYIVIAGLANGYSSYVTTEEEYQAQRYEVCMCVCVLMCGTSYLHF